MRQLMYGTLLAVVGLGVACDGGASGAGDPAVVKPTADRGAVSIEAIAPYLFPDQVAVFDITISDGQGRHAKVGRSVWPTPDHQLMPISVACDPALNPYSAEVYVVALYDGQPEPRGEFGEPPSSGALPFENPAVQRVDFTCEAGSTFQYRFKLSFDPAKVLLGVNVSVEAGALGDALWELVMSEDEELEEALWTDRATTSGYGPGDGGVSFRAPCGDPLSAARRVFLEVSLVGLYASRLGLVGAFGDPAPEDALEIWPLGPLATSFDCPEVEDVMVAFTATVARVARTGDAVRAEFAGVSCEAGWTCGVEAGAPATLSFACSAGGDQAPALYLDDLMVRCPGQADVALDPTAGAEVTEGVAGGVAHTAWRVAPDLADELAAGQACTLEARGTAATRDRTEVVEIPNVLVAPPPGAWMKNGTIPGGAVYPLLRWSIPLSDAMGPVCTNHQLDVGGAITVTYTGTRDPETVFAHNSL